MGTWPAPPESLCVLISKRGSARTHCPGRCLTTYGKHRIILVKTEIIIEPNAMITGYLLLNKKKIKIKITLEQNLLHVSLNKLLVLQMCDY